MFNKIYCNRCWSKIFRAIPNRAQEANGLWLTFFAGLFSGCDCLISCFVIYEVLREYIFDEGAVGFMKDFAVL